MLAIRLAVACVVMNLGVATAEAGFIINGSFEDPVVTVGGFTDFGSGSTTITGWTVVGTDVVVLSGSFTQSGITFQAQDGKQSLDLTGVNSNSKNNGVSQDVTTTIGGNYLLSFYVGSTFDDRFFFPSTVDLSIDGGARVSYTNLTAPNDKIDWKLFTVAITATSTTTNLTFFNGSESNNFQSSLDNVSLESRDVVPTPAPASSILLGLGMVSMLTGTAFRRRF